MALVKLNLELTSAIALVATSLVLVHIALIYRSVVVVYESTYKYGIWDEGIVPTTRVLDSCDIARCNRYL